jgi:LMBR1 domain-containing protein 1
VGGVAPGGFALTPPPPPHARTQDKNQAWFPKIVVVLGLTLCQLSVLMLPLDVANRNACDQTKLLSACTYTLPMTDLWTYVYITMIVWVGFVIPFTLFYYEADSEKDLFQRLVEAAQSWFVFVIAFALGLGIGYGVGGYIIFNSPTLQSGLVRLSSDLSGALGCIPNNAFASLQGSVSCDGVANSGLTWSKWSTRTTFPIYCIALATIMGWLLFMVFAGVGLVALPVDMIKSYIYRPQKLITKTEYIRQAGDVGRKAKALLDGLREVQLDVRRNGRSRRSRGKLKGLTSELVALEEEEMKLREVYPQSEDAELSWAMTVIGYFLNFFGGVLAACISGTWLVHILIYMFLDPPLDPLLNTMFTKMDAVFGLFGTGAFAVFCFYLVLATLKGNFKVGMNFLIFSVHPMSPGNTLMSSFLFNTSLIMLCSISIIQFCSAAFDQYANETSIDEIFGNQITNLKGIGLLFQTNTFIFALFSISGLTALVLPFVGRIKHKPKANFDETYGVTD